MPQIDEVRRAKEIWPERVYKKKPSAGYQSARYRKFIWTACSKCGVERWVAIHKGKPRYLLCRKCAMNTPEERQKRRDRALKGKNSQWKNRSKYVDRYGYAWVKVAIGDFFYEMVGNLYKKRHKNGWVLEHRLVMAKYLKRCLLSWEIVHHKNGMKGDNRLENLQLLPTQASHTSSIQMKRTMNQVLQQNTELQLKLEEQIKQIRLLQWQIQELTKSQQLL